MVTCSQLCKQRSNWFGLVTFGSSLLHCGVARMKFANSRSKNPRLQREVNYEEWMELAKSGLGVHYPGFLLMRLQQNHAEESWYLEQCDEEGCVPLRLLMINANEVSAGGCLKRSEWCWEPGNGCVKSMLKACPILSECASLHCSLWFEPRGAREEDVLTLCS